MIFRTADASWPLLLVTENVRFRTPGRDMFSAPEA